MGMGVGGLFSYSVKHERSLREIAEQFDCSEHALRPLNTHLGLILKRGDVVKIPGNAGVCPIGSFYRIKNRQSIAYIAEKFNVPLEKMIAANPCLNLKRIVPGQIVIIPRQHLSEEWPKMMKVMEYTIKETDTIGDVLRKFDMSILQLKKLNPDRDVLALEAGESVKVPVWPEYTNADGYYVILRGENLVKLAGKFGVSAMELLRNNPNLRPQEFCEGQRILLPQDAVFNTR